MAGLTHQYPIVIPSPDKTYDQLGFLSSCALASTHNSHMGKEELATQLARRWTHSSKWEIINLSSGKFVVKFPSQASRDEALNCSGNTLPNIPISLSPWSIHANSVYTLSEEGFWIHLEGIP